MENENKQIEDFSFFKNTTNNIQTKKKDYKKIIKFLMIGASALTVVVSLSASYNFVYNYYDSEQQLKILEEQKNQEKIKYIYLENYKFYKNNKKEIIQNLVDQLTIYDQVVNLYMDFNNELYYSKDSIKYNSKIREELQLYRENIYKIINDLNDLSEKKISIENNNFLYSVIKNYSIGSLNRSNSLEELLTENIVPNNQDSESAKEIKKKYDSLIQKELSNIFRPNNKSTKPKMI